MLVEFAGTNRGVGFGEDGVNLEHSLPSDAIRKDRAEPDETAVRKRLAVTETYATRKLRLNILCLQERADGNVLK
jgi:hypothetical protein